MSTRNAPQISTTRKGSKHDRTGCLTCRQRRKKCSVNTLPTCGACQRLNLECVREPKRQLVEHARRKSPIAAEENHARTVSSLGCANLCPSVEGSPTLAVNAESRRYALRYYVTTLTRYYTICEQHNSFLSAFLPMAIEAPTLSNALVAWAAGHLSMIDVSYKIPALEAYSHALRTLRESMSGKSQNHLSRETNIATCLVLLTSEVCLGRQSGWVDHLMGAKYLITSTGSPREVSDHREVSSSVLEKSSEGRWILRNYAYHSILGSVTLGTIPLISSVYLQGVGDELDTYLGVGTELLGFVSETSFLNAEASAHPLSQLYRCTTQDTFDRRQKVTQLETSLRNWYCGTDVEVRLAAVAYAYKSAALIYLYQHIHKHLLYYQSFDEGLQFPQIDCDPRAGLFIKTKAQVSTLLEHISKIPEQDTAESPLLFPLFMAGVEAESFSEIVIIRSRLLSLYDKRRFQNITQAVNVLEEVWRRRFSALEVNWRDVLAETGRSLLLT